MSNEITPNSSPVATPQVAKVVQKPAASVIADIKDQVASTDVFTPRPMNRMEKALSLFKSVGINISSPKESGADQISGLMKDLLPFGDTDLTAILRTMRVMNQVQDRIRNELTQVEAGERYVEMAKDFTSIRKDGKRMLEQVEAGKTTIMDRVANTWMDFSRGSIQKRYNSIEEVATAIHADSAKTLKTMRAVSQAYDEARSGFQEARILAGNIRNKTKASWDQAKEALSAADGHLSELREMGADDNSINIAVLNRDAQLSAAREAERLYDLATDLYNNLSVGYETGDVISVRLNQASTVHERALSQSITFFQTNSHVLTALSAAASSLRSIHETTQGVETMKKGIDDALGDLGTTGNKILEAGIRAGYGATINPNTIRKLMDDIITFQENQHVIKNEMRAEAENAEKEIRQITEDGRERISKLIIDQNSVPTE